MALTIPGNLAESARRYAELREWIDSELASVVARAGEMWSLRVGEPFEPGGQCGWVAPVRDAAGADMALKVEYGPVGGEARDEAAGLRAWDGNGTVRLFDCFEQGPTVALLLERCVPGTMLGQSLPEEEQDLVVADLLRRLWELPIPPGTFRPLSEMCAAWADEFEAAPGDRLDPGIARDGIALFRELPLAGDKHVLLCTDLHAENILAAHREPWLVVDPKPYAGDPAYDVLQHMLNCDGRLAADPRGLADRMAALCGLDAARVRLWLFARSVQESPENPLMREVARRMAP